MTSDIAVRSVRENGPTVCGRAKIENEKLKIERAESGVGLMRPLSIFNFSIFQFRRESPHFNGRNQEEDFFYRQSGRNGSISRL